MEKSIQILTIIKYSKKDGSQLISNLIDFVSRTGDNYYPQVFLEKRK